MTEPTPQPPDPAESTPPPADPATPATFAKLAEWFEHRSDEVLERQGIESALLLAEERVWIQRRTERVSFVGSSRICREMDVEFTVPDLAALHGREEWAGAPLVLPIALPAKRPLKDFRIRDEDGRPLPTLTREENGALAARLLEDQAEQVLEELKLTGLELAELELFRDVVGARRDRKDRPTSGERAKRSKAALKTFRAVATPMADPAALAPEKQRIYYLWKNETVNGLLRQLHERFVLFVKMDGLRIGDRRIVTIAYEEEVDTELGWFSSGGGRMRRKWRAGRQRLAQGLGWHHLTIRVRTRAIFGAESYHVEFVVPDDVFIKQAELGTRLELMNRMTRERTVTKTVLRREGHSERAHLYESGILSAPPGSHDPIKVAASEVGYAEFGLALKPSSLWAPLVIGLLTTGILGAGMAVHATGHTAAVEASTVLLVVLPAAFAAYLLPGEHRLVRKMYRQLRLVVLAQALVAFAAAGFFVVDFSADFKFARWRDLGILSLLGVAFVAATLVHSWHRVPEQWVTDLPEPTTYRTHEPDSESETEAS